MKNKKRYISNEIKNGFKEWVNHKIEIFAPTGSGKSEFVLGKLIPDCREKGRTVLILANRSALARQYKYEDALRNVEPDPNVTIQTYQAFVSENLCQGGLMNVFEGYDVVVLDEIHFFISDSDFNSRDTYLMWQAILHSVGPCVIFMTATPDEIMPFLKEYEERIQKLYRDGRSIRGYANLFRKYSLEADYHYIEPMILPDEESLVAFLANSEKKSIIFIDDIAKGKQFKDKICGINSKKSVVCINADSLDSGTKAEKDVIKALYMAGRVDCDVLITTSVLDNGVSIHDKSVGNVSIFTMSKTSFLQMLGRVRVESVVDKVNLILVPQKPEDWEAKELMLDAEVKEIDRLTQDGKFEYRCEFLCVAVLSDSKMVDLYKSLFVLVPRKENFPVYHGEGNQSFQVQGARSRECRLVVNRLTIAKKRQMLHTAQKMHALSRRNEFGPCYEQFGWLGKRPTEVICQSSAFMEEREKAFKDRLLCVQGFSMTEFAKWKREVTAEFRKDCLKRFKIRSGSPIREEDLKLLLEELGCRLVVEVDKDTRKNRYTITRSEA